MHVIEVILDDYTTSIWRDNLSMIILLYRYGTIIVRCGSLLNIWRDSHEHTHTHTHIYIYIQVTLVDTTRLTLD